MLDPGTRARYLETDYIIDDDPPIVLRIGERHDGLRILLASFNAECAAFLTAWNPGSEKRSFDENLDQQAELLADIEAMHLNYFVGRGQHPVSDWYEDSYLVLGLRKEDAEQLARKYQQSAYVFITLSAIPELVVVD